MSIESVFNLGEDAFTNLFEMVFTKVPSLVTAPTGFDIQKEKLRITNFTVPGSGWESYEIPYITESITRVGSKVEITKEFSIDIRVDRNYNIYKFFWNWKNAVLNSYTGAMGVDNQFNDGLRTSISIWAIQPGPGGTPVPGVKWKFEGVICKNVPDIDFDYDNSDPLSISIDFEFLRMDDTELAN
jgi:hypothetical protein